MNFLIKEQLMNLNFRKKKIKYHSCHITTVCVMGKLKAIIESEQLLLSNGAVFPRCFIRAATTNHTIMWQKEF